MTQLLEKVVQQISCLSDEEQDALAAFILAEMESEHKWDMLFGSSQDVLADMAANALDEEKAGKTLTLDLDRDFS